MARHYTGIGSRETPQRILEVMNDLGRFLGSKGFILRSGGAGGADIAFERGCDAGAHPKQIFLPWSGFNQRRADSSFLQAVGTYAGVTPDALALAERFHPAWERCSRGARALHARNGYQVLGPQLDTPSEFVICWTVGGRGQGGTGQALRIARDRGIPIIDLGTEAGELSLHTTRLFD